jgi:multidrug resistance protein MdtO
MFVVSLLAAWIKAGDERIAYAGFQIGLAFYLSDLTGYGPTTDMTTARDRIVGILVGNFITYAVFTTLWPASAYTGIAPCLRTVAAHLEKLRRTVGLQARANVMAGLQSALSLGERQVEYALAEPLHMRRTMKNLGALHNAFATAERIGIDILEDAPSDPAHRIAALEKLTA